MTAVLAWLRGLLAVGLLGGFYALAFVLIAVDAVFVVLVLWAAFYDPTRGGSWTLAVGGSIPAVFALIYGVATVSRPEEQPIGAVPVRRREAPGLWRLVEDLADQLGTRPPTQIFLTPDVNAAVSEEARMLGLAVGARTMYIGVPLLTQLTSAQLRAVLCHEFGHYAGGHTRFGAVTYRGAMALNSTLFRLRMTARVGQGVTSYAAIFHAIINLYAKVYLRLSLAVRRRQELEADARAAAVAGPAVTADALRAVHALGHAWAGFLDMFMRPVQRLGFVPEDLFEAFTAMVSDPLVQERLADLREHPTEGKRSPMDSHPPLARRLGACCWTPRAAPRRPRGPRSAPSSTRSHTASSGSWPAGSPTRRSPRSSSPRRCTRWSARPWPAPARRGGCSAGPRATCWCRPRRPARTWRSWWRPPPTVGPQWINCAPTCCGAV